MQDKKNFAEFLSFVLPEGKDRQLPEGFGQGHKRALF